MLWLRSTSSVRLMVLTGIVATAALLVVGLGPSTLLPHADTSDGRGVLLGYLGLVLPVVAIARSRRT